MAKQDYVDVAAALRAVAEKAAQPADNGTDDSILRKEYVVWCIIQVLPEVNLCILDTIAEMCEGIYR